MAARRGVLIACLFTTLPIPCVIAQVPSAGQLTRWAPPAPCTGDSAETHARRGNMIPVPNLQRMSMRRAALTLQKLDLEIDVRHVRMNGPPGVVISQAPAFTSFAAPGDVVVVCVRRAATIPSVVGRTFEEGRNILADSGFEASKSNSFVDDASKVGVVLRQQPVAGAAVPLGTVDALIVGMAPPIASLARPLSRQEPARAQPPQTSPGGTDSAVRRTLASQAQTTSEVEPMDWSWLSWLWKLAVGIGVLLAVRRAMVRSKDRRQLAAMRVVPRQHPGRPHVVSATRVRDEVSNA